MKNFFFRSRTLRELKRFFKENAAQGKPLCLMDDLVFKAMFTSDTEDSREALRRLLGACIKREISSVRVINNELIPAHLDAKAVRLDVNVTFNDGEVADMEMQMGKSDDNLKTRAAYYAAMLLSGQSKRGAPYKAVKRVYQIFFLNCVLFPDSKRIPRRYKLMEINEHDNLTEAVEIIFYELPKLEEHVKNYFKGKAGMETLSEDEKWCIYLKYRHEENAEPLIMELCRKEEGIMRAEKTVEKISRDYLRYVREMNIAKNEYERGYMLETAREEGLAEGLTKGLVEGHAEGLAEGLVEGQTKGRTEAIFDIAKKMKKAGRPMGEIEEFTGLSSRAIKRL
jgi:predicted transposase/invertase (TIGR01784 family)